MELTSQGLLVGSDTDRLGQASATAGSGVPTGLTGA
jgi:hypothetical protein